MECSTNEAKKKTSVQTVQEAVGRLYPLVGPPQAQRSQAPPADAVRSAVESDRYALGLNEKA